MQITDHIHRLKIPFTIPTGPDTSVERFVYIYLVMTDAITVIDSGVAGCEPMIFEYIEGLGKEREHIRTLLLTHAHPDHVGGALPLVEACRCAVWAHASEIDWIEDTDKQFRERPVPGFATLVAGSVKVSRSLEEGDVLDLGAGVRARVLHTPGHSRGSISLCVEPDRALLTGDAVPQPGGMPIYEDVDASIASLRKLEALENTKVLLSAWDSPRHGDDALKAIREGIDYIETVERAVRECLPHVDVEEPMALCKAVVAKLGLPPFMVNPLVARTFLAHTRR